MRHGALLRIVGLLLAVAFVVLPLRAGMTMPSGAQSQAATMSDGDAGMPCSGCSGNPSPMGDCDGNPATMITGSCSWICGGTVVLPGTPDEPLAVLPAVPDAAPGRDGTGIPTAPEPHPPRRLAQA